MAAQLINLTQRLIQRQLLKTLNLTSSSGCRIFGFKTFAGKLTGTVAFLNRRESWTTVCWLVFTSVKPHVIRKLRLCFFFHIPLIFNLAEECILLSRTGVGLGKGSSSDISIAAVKKASHVAQLKTNCDGNKAEESQADRSIGEKKPRMLGDDGPSMMELSGFNIKRQEFENEYDNDAEQLLVDMEFNNSDTDNERELKLSVLRIYNKRLEERKRRKAFILERNLLYPDPFEKNLSPEEKKLCQKYKVFMRFHSKKEHEELLRTVIEEHRVLKRIQDLQEARVAGCRTSTEAETYIELKRRKEAQAIPDGKFVPRTVRPKGEVDDSPHESKAIDSECKDLSSTNTEQDLVKFLDAWDINGFPEADLLSEAEKQLCGEMRILPSHYLNMLQTISIGRLNGSITQKSDAHRLFMVDSSKVDKIYDMLTKKGIAP